MRKDVTKSRGVIFVISGPSGSGKTTLRDRMLADENFRKLFTKSVSVTTRPKRSKEKHTKDYFFLSTAQFKDKRRSKEILEWTRYLGYYYGTPRDFVERQLARGRNIMLCLDLRGARRIKKLYPRNSVTIFVLPPSVRTLRVRIEGRCSDTKKEEIARRLKLAEKELAESRTYDYRLVNNQLETAVKKMKGILLREIIR